MKYSLILLLVALSCTPSSTSQSSQPTPVEVSGDPVFLSHFRAVRSGMNDSIRPDSLFFHVHSLVKITGIEPAGAKNIVGYNAVSDSDLLNWADWYITNR